MHASLASARQSDPVQPSYQPQQLLLRVHSAHGWQRGLARCSVWVTSWMDCNLLLVRWSTCTQPDVHPHRQTHLHAHAPRTPQKQAALGVVGGCRPHSQQVLSRRPGTRKSDAGLVHQYAVHTSTKAHKTTQGAQPGCPLTLPSAQLCRFCA